MAARASDIPVDRSLVSSFEFRTVMAVGTTHLYVGGMGLTGKHQKKDREQKRCNPSFICHMLSLFPLLEFFIFHSSIESQHILETIIDQIAACKKGPFPVLINDKNGPVFRYFFEPLV